MKTCRMLSREHGKTEDSIDHRRTANAMKWRDLYTHTHHGNANRHSVVLTQSLQSICSIHKTKQRRSNQRRWRSHTIQSARHATGLSPATKRMNTVHSISPSKGTPYGSWWNSHRWKLGKRAGVAAVRLTINEPDKRVINLHAPSFWHVSKYTSPPRI